MATHKVDIEAAGKWFCLSVTKPRYTQRNESSATSYSAARLPAGLTSDQKRTVCQEIANALSTFCSHSRDCCGHWYATAYVGHNGRKVSIKWIHTRNI